MSYDIYIYERSTARFALWNVFENVPYLRRFACLKFSAEHMTKIGILKRCIAAPGNRYCGMADCGQRCL